MITSNIVADLCLVDKISALIFPDFPFSVGLLGVSEKIAASAAAAFVANLGEILHAAFPSVVMHSEDDETQEKRCLASAKETHGETRPVFLPGGFHNQIQVGPLKLFLAQHQKVTVITGSSTALQSYPQHIWTALEIAIMRSLALQGGMVLHGAGFMVDKRRILVLGNSGSGKTTLSMAALAMGAQLLSDDSLLAGFSGNVLLVRSFRRDAFLRRKTLPVVPASLLPVLEKITAESEPRWRLPRRCCPALLQGNMTPETLWVVSINRQLQTSRVLPMTCAETLAALVQATTPLYLSAQCPREKSASLPLLSTLAETTRGFRIELAPELLVEPIKTLKRLLSATESAVPANRFANLSTVSS